MKALFIALTLAVVATTCQAAPGTGLDGGWVYFQNGPPGQQLSTELAFSVIMRDYYFSPPFANGQNGAAYDALMSTPNLRVFRTAVYHSPNADFFGITAEANNDLRTKVIGRWWCCFPATGQTHNYLVVFDAQARPEPEIWLTIDDLTYAYALSWGGGGNNPWFNLHIPNKLMSFFIDLYARDTDPSFDPNNTVTPSGQVQDLYMDALNINTGWNLDNSETCVVAAGHPPDFISNYAGSCGPFDIGISPGRNGFYNTDF